jgi:predicted nucleotide-binding protein
MRSRGAGVIHVGPGRLPGSRRQQAYKDYDNVLIEIGAAMALYGKEVILLVEGARSSLKPPRPLSV